jgi:hypothetical protein
MTNGWPSDYQRLHGAPLNAPEQVRPLLRDPDIHWKKGRSAYEAAHAWVGQQKHRSAGIPSRVSSVLKSDPAWHAARVVTGFFEHATPLDTQKGPSNTDLLVVCDIVPGLGVMAVEAKAGETFGERICDWLTITPSPGKDARWKWACEFFGVGDEACRQLRWQLFHRTASAIIEARRFRSTHAIMLVHDFSGRASSLDDYLVFASALGIGNARVDGLSDAREFGGISLQLAWVCDEPTTL